MKKNKKKIGDYKIIANIKIAPDYYEIELAAIELSKKFNPGQFVQVQVQENTTDPFLRIPLAIHATSPRGIKLLYKVVGRGTETLSNKAKGSSINLLGPLGNGFTTDQAIKNKKAVAFIVGGGHGIAPLYSLVQFLRQNKIPVESFVGAGSCEEILCETNLKKCGAGVCLATENGTKGHRGFVTELLEKSIKNNKEKEIAVFACGPRPMLKEVARICKKTDTPAQVSLDAYMACGIGACKGCAIATKDGYKLVCKDGPIFDAQEIDWENES